MLANVKLVALSFALAVTGVAAVPQQLSSVLSVPTDTLLSSSSITVPTPSGSAPASVPTGTAPTASSDTLITNSGSATGVPSSILSVPNTGLPSSAPGTSVPATTVAVTATSRSASGSVAGSGTGTAAAASSSSTGTNLNGAAARGASGLVAALGVLVGAGLAL